MADIGKTLPEPYNLNDPNEVLRLYRECAGYLHTCRRDHHGTDMQGRKYAMEALEELMKKTTVVRFLGGADQPRDAH